jgi:hypothetical protein
MKKKYLFFVLLAMGMVASVACSREHQCKCFYSDNPNDDQYKVFVVDGSISCDDFEMMGYEVHVATEGVNSLQRIDTLRIHCRDFGE